MNTANDKNRIELVAAPRPVKKGDRVESEEYGPCVAVADSKSVGGWHSVQVRRMTEKEAEALNVIEALRDLLKELAPGLEGRGVSPTRYLDTPKNRAVIRARAIVAKHEGRAFLAPYLHEA